MDAVRSVAFSESNSVIVSGSEDKTVKVWPIDTSKQFVPRGMAWYLYLSIDQVSFHAIVIIVYPDSKQYVQRGMACSLYLSIDQTAFHRNTYCIP